MKLKEKTVIWIANIGGKILERKSELIFVKWFACLVGENRIIINKTTGGLLAVRVCIVGSKIYFTTEEPTHAFIRAQKSNDFFEMLLLLLLQPVCVQHVKISCNNNHHRVQNHLFNVHGARCKRNNKLRLMSSSDLMLPFMRMRPYDSINSVESRFCLSRWLHINAKRGNF